MLHRVLTGAFALLLTTACTAETPQAPQQAATSPSSSAPAATPAAQQPAAAPAAPAADRPATGPTSHPGNYTAGVDYIDLGTPQTFGSGPGIEVVEVFGYGCIHCATLQPLINEWKPTLPRDVDFIYVPAVFGGAWEAWARAYYTAETMGVLERSHDAVFNAIHTERMQFRNLEDIAGLYTRFGVDKAQFLATMDSFAVNAKIARSAQQVPRWGVEATPTMVVAGRYRVQAPREGGFEKMLDIVDFLVAKERAARAPAA
jgi:thiol:disulfide interchange protein DsbA